MLGVSCLLCICYEINKDGASHISWQFDNGKRKGIDYFIKLIA
jgi:hypothetical protein